MFFQSYLSWYFFMLIIKSRMFDISINFFSLNILTFLIRNLFQKIERNNAFSKIDFLHLNLYRIYWKYVSTFLSIFSCVLGKDKLVYSSKLFALHTKSIDAIWKNRHIMEWYACILKIFAVKFLFPANALTWFRNMLSFKAIEVSYIAIHIQRYLMRYYWFIPIKIYCICPILNFRISYP